MRGAHAACLEVLKLNAKHADAYFLLGMVTASANNYAKACELIERAIDIDDTQAEYPAQYARCLAMLNRRHEALTQADLALTLGIDDALTFDTLGVVFSRLGAHARAVEMFVQAIEMQDGNASFQYNLATSLSFLGRIDEAEQAFDACIGIDPDYYRAHSALATLRTQTTDRNHISRLTARLHHVGEDVDGELHLCHALAKEYEDVGDFDAAFEFLSRGQSKKRASLDYSIDEDRSLFARVESLFHENAFQGRPAGCPSSEPIFVVGMPRTGTTLIERILSSHSDVTSAGELPNFGIVLKGASATRSSRVLDEDTLVRGFELDHAQLGHRYIDSTRPATGKTAHFIDKMPLNFFYIGFIHLALPNAKILCLRRDPLDTCVSNFRQLFALNFSYYNYAYDLADIGRYYALFDRLIAHWDKVLAGKVLQVQYERLVSDQAAQTRRLLDFCGLQWDADCLDFERNLAPVATASAVQVRQKMYSDSVGRWRHYASKLEGLHKQLRADGIALKDSML